MRDIAEMFAELRASLQAQIDNPDFTPAFRLAKQAVLQQVELAEAAWAMGLQDGFEGHAARAFDILGAPPEEPGP
jgi:hypothetical protein